MFFTIKVLKYKLCPIGMRQFLLVCRSRSNINQQLQSMGTVGIKSHHLALLLKEEQRRNSTKYAKGTSSQAGSFLAVARSPWASSTPAFCRIYCTQIQFSSPVIIWSINEQQHSRLSKCFTTLTVGYPSLPRVLKIKLCQTP